MAVKLTESRLRKIIREEVRKMSESWHDEDAAEMEAHLQPGPNSAFIVIPGTDWDMTMGDEDYEMAVGAKDAAIEALVPMAREFGVALDLGHGAGIHISGQGAQRFVPVAMAHLAAHGVEGARLMKKGESPSALSPRPHNVY